MSASIPFIALRSLRCPCRPALHAQTAHQLQRHALQQVSRTPQSSSFSTTPSLQKRKQVQKKDRRITAIRYFLHHPLTPRPLKFSRLRSLRHWTIARAWNTFQQRQRQAHELDLERQYASMRSACEALRLINEDGVTVEEPSAVIAGRKSGTEQWGADWRDSKGRGVGRLYRLAMFKGGDASEGVPIEYARMQTDWPRREGWDHDWRR